MQVVETAAPVDLQPSKPVQPLQGEDVEHVQLLLRLSELVSKVEEMKVGVGLEQAGGSHSRYSTALAICHIT